MRSIAREQLSCLLSRRSTRTASASSLYVPLFRSCAPFLSRRICIVGDHRPARAQPRACSHGALASFTRLPRGVVSPCSPSILQISDVCSPARTDPHAQLHLGNDHNGPQPPPPTPPPHRTHTAAPPPALALYASFILLPHHPRRWRAHDAERSARARGSVGPPPVARDLAVRARASAGAATVHWELGERIRGSGDGGGCRGA